MLALSDPAHRDHDDDRSELQLIRTRPREGHEEKAQGRYRPVDR